MKTLIAIAALLVLPIDGVAQTVVKYDGSSDSFDAKWTWAESEIGKTNGSHWIGYSIERLMHVNSHMGRYSSKQTYPTFGELLYGIKSERSERFGDNSDRKVMKEMVIMFHVNRSGKVGDVMFSTLDGEAYMDDDIYWLGHAEIDNSLTKVESLMSESRDDDVREDLVAAISMHDTPRALSLLRSILKGDDVSDVREQAAFWMSPGI